METIETEIIFLKDTIGKELRKQRANLNLTKTELVKKINDKGQKFDIATLTRYENGETLQSLDKLCILLNFYGIDLQYFFNSIYENFHRSNELIQELEEFSEELKKKEE